MPRETFVSISSLKQKKTLQSEQSQPESTLKSTLQTENGHMRRNSSYKMMRKVISNRSLNKSRYNQSQKPDELGENVKSILLKIFQYYASYGDRTNLKYMRSNKFHKLMRDAKIPVDKTSLDILFVGQNKHKHNMKFQTFLDLLPKLALMINPDEESVKTAFEAVFQEYFVPVYELIMSNTFFGSLRDIVNSELEFEEIEQVFEVLNVLLDMYREYFPSEFHKEGDFSNLELLHELSLGNFYKFCSDYEILPFYISKAIATSVWENVTNVDLDWLQNQLSGTTQFIDCGYLFTFSRFILFLISVNRIIMVKRRNALQNDNGDCLYDTVSESLLMLFNHLQQSRGFKNTQGKHSVSNAFNGLVSSRSIDTSGVLDMRMSRSSQMFGRYNRILNSNETSPSRIEVLRDARSVVSGDMGSRQGSDRNLMRNTSMSRMSTSSKKITKLSRNNTLRSNIFYEDDSLPVFEKYADQLNKIFVAYASRGEPTNTTKLKSIKFLKLLKQAGIVKRGNSISAAPRKSMGYRDMNISKLPTRNRHLTTVDADMIFVSLTGTRFRNSMLPHQRTFSRSKGLLFNNPSYNSKRTKTGGILESKLEFETFLKSLELIAEQLYPELELQDGITYLIENKLLSLVSKKQVEVRSAGLHHIAVLKDLLSNENVVKILGTLHENVQVYYKMYSDSKGVMNFENFFRFYKDFEYFPYLISKSKLAQYFYALATLNEKSGGNDLNSNKFAYEQNDREVIDSHLFVESIALISIYTNHGDSSNSVEESLLFGIQRLDNSKGRTLAIKRLGSTRAVDGFTWSLMTGMGNFRKQLIENLTSRSHAHTDRKKDLSFSSIYG